MKLQTQKYCSWSAYASSLNVFKRSEIVKMINDLFELLFFLAGKIVLQTPLTT